MSVFECPKCGAKIEYDGGSKAVTCQNCWEVVNLISEEMAEKVIAGDGMILKRLLIVANETIDSKSYQEAIDFVVDNYLNEISEYKECLSDEKGLEVANFIIDSFSSLATRYYNYYKKQISRNQNELMKLFDESLTDDMVSGSVNNMRQSNLEREIRKYEKDKVNIIPEYARVISKLCDSIPNQLELYRPKILEIIRDDCFKMVREKISFRVGPVI